MIPRVAAARICQEILSTSGCNLSDCRKQCYQNHASENGFGNCVEGKPEVYACICYYSCG